MNVELIRGNAEECRRIVDKYRYTPPEELSAEDRSALGSVSDYLGEIIAETLQEPPQVTYQLPLAMGGVFGRTKWLPGSLGCDVFVARGSPVFAPADCEVRWVVGGTGLQGGAEIILWDSRSQSAWRYRHVAGHVIVGQKVKRGERVATVMDPSLDQLGPVPNWAQPMPDGWQHLDLSVNKGTDQFSPQGGGGGNYNASLWLSDLGYSGRVLTRTPGPTDIGFTLFEAASLLAGVRGGETPS